MIITRVILYEGLIRENNKLYGNCDIPNRILNWFHCHPKRNSSANYSHFFIQWEAILIDFVALCRGRGTERNDYITPTINEAFDKTTAHKNNSCSVHSQSRVIVVVCRQIDFLRALLLLILIPGQQQQQQQHPAGVRLPSIYHQKESLLIVPSHSSLWPNSFQCPYKTKGGRQFHRFGSHCPCGLDSVACASPIFRAKNGETWASVEAELIFLTS